MGFSLKGAIGGGITGFLTGGPAGAAVGAGLGGFAGGGSDKKASVGFATLPQSEQAEAARTELFDLATGELPEIPTRGIVSPGAKTPAAEAARKTLTAGLEPQGQQDFLSLPEVQAIIQEAKAKGDLLANRIGRGLQASGNITSTTGRDVLGRAVEKVESNIVSSLAPFISAERGRAFAERGRSLDVARTLEGLELSDSERIRLTEQAREDAAFEQELTTALAPFNLTAPLLQSIIGLQPAVQPIVQGGGAKDPLGGFGDIIGPLLAQTLKNKEK